MANDGLKLYKPGDGTGPEVASALSDRPESKDKIAGQLIVVRRTTEWREHHIEWMQLQDSYEGGNRYRNATYGPDRKGLPTRNLFRHRREYPDPQAFPTVYEGFAGNAGNTGSNSIDVAYGPYPGQIGADPATTAQDDDYELRRARTPVPEFTSYCVDIHLGKIYDQEVHREGPKELEEWWKDVDGRGTDIDDWMKDTFAPLFLVCGNLDVAVDHPQLPKGMEEPKTQAHVEELGLDAAIASFLLPENVCWWVTDFGGNYVELLVREWINDGTEVREDDVRNKKDDNLGPEYRKKYEHFRHWTLTDVTLYNHDGSKVVEQKPNTLGYIPVKRMIDKPVHRQPMVGRSRYMGIAMLQREFYNRDSELILSDTLQAHPLLSGAEDFCKADGSMSVGPGYILPKKKNPESGQYEPWEYVSPPKDPAESLRRNKQDIVDMIDREAALTKPPGATGASREGGTVGQSGISKQLDAVTGNKLLHDIALSLAKAERFLAEIAYRCITGKPVDKAIRETIKITYPAKFELYSADEIAASTIQLQTICSGAGSLPQIECTLINNMVTTLAVGLDDAQYDLFKTEIQTFMATKAMIKEQQHEFQSAGIQSASDSLGGKGSEEQQGGEDPTGQSGGTLVSNMLPAVVS